MRQTMSRKRRGFALVELSMVVIILIGVLAAFGAPRLLRHVERSKAASALKYLAAVQTAQERYRDREGAYATDLALLEIEQTAPVHFTLGAVTAGDTGSLQDSWTLTLTREGASAGYGAYTVTFTEHGYDAANSTIDVLPDIKSMDANASGANGL